MPRYKVLSEGEKVRLNVEVVFESVKMQGQYLHTGNKLPEQMGTDLFEVDLSVTPSTFLLVKHQTYQQAITQYIKVFTDPSFRKEKRFPKYQASPLI